MGPSDEMKQARQARRNAKRHAQRAGVCYLITLMTRPIKYLFQRSCITDTRCRAFKDSIDTTFTTTDNITNFGCVTLASFQLHLNDKIYKMGMPKGFASQTLGAGPSRMPLTPPSQPQTISQILGMSLLLSINSSSTHYKEGIRNIQLSTHIPDGMSLL